MIFHVLLLFLFCRFPGLKNSPSDKKKKEDDVGDPYTCNRGGNQPKGNKKKNESFKDIERAHEISGHKGSPGHDPKNSRQGCNEDSIQRPLEKHSLIINKDKRDEKTDQAQSKCRPPCF